MRDSDEGLAEVKVDKILYSHFIYPAKETPLFPGPGTMTNSYFVCIFSITPLRSVSLIILNIIPVVTKIL